MQEGVRSEVRFTGWPKSLAVRGRFRQNVLLRRRFEDLRIRGEEMRVRG